MTKERLNGHRKMRADISQREAELAEIRESSYISGAILDGMPKGKGGRMSDSTSAMAIRLVKLEAELGETKREADLLLGEIEVAIECLSPQERRLMRARYIACLEWDDIYALMHQSKSSIHTLHGTILRKLKITD